MLSITCLRPFNSQGLLQASKHISGPLLLRLNSHSPQRVTRWIKDLYVESKAMWWNIYDLVLKHQNLTPSQSKPKNIFNRFFFSCGIVYSILSDHISQAVSWFGLVQINILQVRSTNLAH